MSLREQVQAAATKYALDEAFNNRDCPACGEGTAWPVDKRAYETGAYNAPTVSMLVEAIKQRLAFENGETSKNVSFVEVLEAFNDARRTKDGE